ncbi:MAG: hypothetical protein V7756_15720 [Halopseudomonas sp.]|uniref:hypothetical protein n=1 Tax=Halopseudomonas sp. TaxID=2901191 RepID=UPI003002D2E6
MWGVTGWCDRGGQARRESSRGAFTPPNGIFIVVIRAIFFFFTAAANAAMRLTHPGLSKPNGLLWKLRFSIGLHMALDGRLLRQLLFFSCPTEHPARDLTAILQKNQFAASLTFCFCCVWSRILFLLFALVFIVVVLDIKHLPCQFLKVFKKQCLGVFPGFATRVLLRRLLP